MKRVLKVTGDGSHTLYVNELDEPYHSTYGALQESRHIFINQGYHHVKKTPLHILEVGFGTGLNLLLTLQESEKDGTEVHYHGVEKYPLTPSEFMELNYEEQISGIPPGSLYHLHNEPWDKEFKMTDTFWMYKEKSDIRSMNPIGTFDLIYFDAFAPDKQPYLWSSEIFALLSQVAKPGCVMVTYSSKGSVRRALISNGFKIEKVPGPPGKREMIRAHRL